MTAGPLLSSVLWRWGTEGFLVQLTSTHTPSGRPVCSGEQLW